MSDDEQIIAVEGLLSRGLDLCVRAQKMDQALDHDEDGMLTRSATPALWVQQQYENDLEQWEGDVRRYFAEHGRTISIREMLTTADIQRAKGLRP